MDEENIKEHFLDVLEKNIGIIFKISRAYTKTAQDREDLINDVTFELWKSFSKFKGESKVSTWIYRVAINTSLNFNKRNDKDRLLYTEDLNRIENPVWISESSDTSQSDLLYECIDELNLLNKAIILLYLDGNSHEEIAEITGISKTNAGTRISRIKDELKRMVILKNQ